MFVHLTQVKRKIKKAFCPPEVVEGNPIVDYAKHIIFGFFGTITINCNGVNPVAATIVVVVAVPCC